jgi:hypothetical protein
LFGFDFHRDLQLTNNLPLRDMPPRKATKRKHEDDDADVTPVTADAAPVANVETPVAEAAAEVSLSFFFSFENVLLSNNVRWVTAASGQTGAHRNRRQGASR